MTGPRNIAVIDIGKTNAKVALVDLDRLTELSVVTRPNTVLPGPPYPHFDTDGHWAFILDALASMQASVGVDAISITTHGASAALLAADGARAAPILDYEHHGPDSTAAAYDAMRPPFDLTGSPRLSAGLNVGAQLHWQFHQDPHLYARTAAIVTYPQYWAHRLTGVVASDVSSIGCHTDLWVPRAGMLSPLADALRIGDKIAPVRKSRDVLGPILPEIAARTGLPPGTPVACGIHDSNASLLPHILAREAAFNVISTGTWVIAMSVGGAAVTPDPARDTLLNVSAFGNAVPSARFMGGREFDLVQAGQPAAITNRDVSRVLANRLLLMPAIVPETGPFQGRSAHWIGGEPAPGTPERIVALSFYLAMMTATCLEMTGARGPNIVEGPFSKNLLYLQMLAAATGRPTERTATQTGTSIGAALLFSSRKPEIRTEPVARSPQSDAMHRYAEAWQAAARGDA